MNSNPTWVQLFSPSILECHHSLSAFIISALGLHLSDGIPFPSFSWLVDGMQGVLPGQASCRINYLVVTPHLDKETKH